MNADVILMILTPASLDIVIRLEMQSAWRSSSKTRYNIALSSYIPVGFHSCTDGVWSELHKACSDFQSYFLEPKAKWWNTQNCSRFSSKWCQHIHRHTCCWMRQMLCFMLGLLFYDFHDYLFELLEKVLVFFLFCFLLLFWHLQLHIRGASLNLRTPSPHCIIYFSFNGWKKESFTSIAFFFLFPCYWCVYALCENCLNKTSCNQLPLIQWSNSLSQFHYQQFLFVSCRATWY